MGVSVPGSRIKSTQRGLITLGSAVLQASATITAIDINKSQIRLQGIETAGSAAGASTDSTSARLWLQNNTTLWAVRNAAGGVMNVAWEITEWM